MKLFSNATISFEISTRPLTMITQLHLYAMYRNGLYETRAHRPIDSDIGAFKPRFDYTYIHREKSTVNSLYHYASYIALDAMQEIKNNKFKHCIAYKQPSTGKRIPIGFLVFCEETIDNKTLVYISHVSAGEIHQGIGTKLIQHVMHSYPEGTEFYLCARRNNPDALECYRKIGFKEDPTHVITFGYNHEYFVGMKKEGCPDRSYTPGSRA